MLTIDPGYVHGSVFSQHQVWVDIKGKVHDIETLEGDYAQNIIGFCHKRAHMFLMTYMAYVVQSVIETGQTPIGSKEIAELLSDTKDAHLAMDQTPLIRALRKRLDILGIDQPKFDSN